MKPETSLTQLSEVQVYSRFDDLPAPYQALFHTCSQNTGFFMSTPWFRHLSTAGMPAEMQLRIYAVQALVDQTKVYAVLPMCHESNARWRHGARVLRALATYYSAQYAPLLDVSAPPAVQLAMLTALARHISVEVPRWDMVAVQPMHQASAAYPLVLQAFSAAGLAVDHYFCYGNWSVAILPDNDGQRSYARYRDNLPSRLKHTLTRKTAQLNKNQRLRMEIFTTEADARIQISNYLRIYERSWKNQEPYPEFMPGWILESARQQWLRLGIATIDEQPAAAQIWLVEKTNTQTKAYIYKLAHDRRYDQTSVGSLLTEHLMRYVIDTDQVDAVDFLHGDEKYKQDWMSERSEFRGMIAYNRITLKGRIAYGVLKAGRYLKQLGRFKPSSSTVTE